MELGRNGGIPPSRSNSFNNDWILAASAGSYDAACCGGDVGLANGDTGAADDDNGWDGGRGDPATGVVIDVGRGAIGGRGTGDELTAALPGEGDRDGNGPDGATGVKF